MRPQIGMRVKLASRGSGRWQSSGGFRSKFGLTVTEIMRGLEELKARGMQDCFKLLHFHLGSQITNIRIVKGALNEAARVYTELAKLGAGLQYLDVGGGLGVDYDGSQTNFESSMNYTLQEYANDVVYHIQTVCDEAGVPHPTIISESGRAIVAYHSVLVFNVLGVSGLRRREGADHAPIPTGSSRSLDLIETYKNVTARNVLEGVPRRAAGARHGAQPVQRRLPAARAAQHGREPVLGDLHQAADASSQTMDEVPEDLQNLDEQLSDTYFCNFSLFQSIPDSWAIKQLFPVMPIHRLQREADRTTPCSATSPATPTASSIASSIAATSRRRCRCTRCQRRRRTTSGVFLVGAYQEILGDLHNLFGDTHAVHVSLDENGDARLDTLIKGDTVREVLDYVEFDAETLLGKLRTDVETAVRAGPHRLRRRRPPAPLLRRRARTATPTSKASLLYSRVAIRRLPRSLLSTLRSAWRSHARHCPRSGSPTRTLPMPTS